VEGDQTTMTAHPPAQTPVAVRLGTVSALTDPAALAGVLGPVAELRREPMTTGGHSVSTFERLDVTLGSGERIRLVLKRVRLALDWGARRTGDTTGREAAPLSEPTLAGIWDAFRCPYRAYAVDGGEVGLLMDDLSPYLLPDDGARVDQTHEDALLAALAALHARFWDSPALGLAALVPPERALAVFGPEAPDEEARQPAPHPLFEWVRQGWAASLQRLPPPLGELLRRPAEPFARVAAGLPRTLRHANTRLDNFAFYPDGTVAAFDFAGLGTGPATLDVGVYLILNARRRARTHEAVLERYRNLLEAARGAPLPAPLWARLVSAGLLYGAAFLLWDRALDVEEGLPGAADEWAWWVDRLGHIAREGAAASLYGR
jgi:hypothetical protein